MKGKFNFSLIYAAGCLCLMGYAPPSIPYAPAAGQPGSTAVAFDAVGIGGWATGVVSVEFGSDVGEAYRNPLAALGPASSGSPTVLVLGRGGSVVLECLPGIADGEGPDFAVYENAFRDTFLELAYVEVSSDGEHFVRFPNYSLTADPVGAFGDVLAEFVHGLAGKFRAGYGTPFDLATLQEAHEAALVGEGGFTGEFRAQLTGNFPFLDLSQVRYVRIIDIVGDGLSRDCEGYAIYDPYPTIITAGFDLDAVAVLNSAQPEIVSFAEWSAGFGLVADASGDADQDRWSNYMEYLFASDPVKKASQPDLTSQLSPDGVFTLTFWRNLSAEALPRLQVSRDGVNWQEYATIDLSTVSRFMDRGGHPAGLVEISIPDASPFLLVRFVASPSS